ncbi:glutamine synthetase family protein [Gulosibacter molinativorax]|uniref:Glutamine synthetase n=1 Tax=Gulosibacter molinativorax TaxID=256821 RepID=A0ABT7C4E0_9MICO|nr:glutamine synthetase family protein [Gulosibacter molinativorax]MDJ1370082.1 glutamine synthetase [Gulosibacter molinativorax]QUY63725.1 Glutamine synthetase [Gulosibacter molinativorax]
MTITSEPQTTTDPYVENLKSREIANGGNLANNYKQLIEKELNDNNALARHRDKNLENDTIEALKEKIERSGVEYLYYMVPTLRSRTVAKMVPAKHFIRNLESGVKFTRNALMDFQLDVFGNPIGADIHSKEFVAMPEPETFNALPWDTSVGRIFSTAYEPEHLPTIGGRPNAVDSRANMKRTHQLLKDVFGLTMKSGLEPEMVWVGDSITPKTIPGYNPAYQVEYLEGMRPIYKRIHEYANQLGFDMIEGDYEDKGQIELNWMFDEIEWTTDRMVTYRQICSQVAREFDVEASFMPKPFLGEMGAGCHHNISLWDEEGNNTLETPGVTELHLSQVGRWAVGGILKHAPGMMLIMASTVNSYKRFWDPGQFAPARADWGLDDRASMVRISANGRAEVRVPDASVNPYLSHSLLLAAVADGIGNQIEPIGPGEQGEDLPRTLGEAVEAFRANPFVQDHLPNELGETYAKMKESEWAQYCATVSQWEFDQYWQAIP